MIRLVSSEHPQADALIRAHAEANLKRFSIDIVRADGTTEHADRIGGTSIEHSIDGMELAGLGGVVRVSEIEQ